MRKVQSEQLFLHGVGKKKVFCNQNSFEKHFPQRTTDGKTELTDQTELHRLISFEQTLEDQDACLDSINYPQSTIWVAQLRSNFIYSLL